MQEVSWNNSRLIRGNLLEGVTKLKQQPGKNILVAGSSQLVNTLMQYDLVDEYRLMVFPVVLGKGKRLFNENIEKGLQHVETRTFHSGVVVLTYRPKQN
ncbi:dihydrofolate reductase family protein [Paenibacillus alvei]|uniref:dihydrofolate reductase family protein n=1 Tax=Paenibacillus alvei TaxID=44250 RepID=UPI003AF24B8B